MTVKLQITPNVKAYYEYGVLYFGSESDMSEAEKVFTSAITDPNIVARMQCEWEVNPAKYRESNKRG